VTAARFWGKANALEGGSTVRPVSAAVERGDKGFLAAVVQEALLLGPVVEMAARLTEIGGRRTWSACPISQRT